MLHLERVRQTEEACRAQAERAAFGLRGERDAVALGVSISESRRRVCVDRTELLTLLFRQLRTAHILHFFRERTDERREIVIEKRREIRVAVNGQSAHKSRRTNQSLPGVAVIDRLLDQ